MSDNNSAPENPRTLVEHYIAGNFKIVYWPAKKDIKGPTERDWPTKPYPIEHFKDGYRVGVLTGTELQPGHHLHDVDIDWAPGSLIAQSFLPPTGFVFGRASKRVSHCFYTTPIGLPSYKYNDIDDTCLIELRGTKANGEIGLQTMVPPSVWSRDDLREPLAFVKFEGVSHVADAELLKQRVCYAAIGMIVAKHLGVNGFGHDPRLAWAGFLLRAGITPDDLITMGEAISVYCHNREIQDVRRVVDSTALALSANQKKVKGGPAFAKILGTNGRKIIERINEWLGRHIDFKRDANGSIYKDHQLNIQRALELMNVNLSYHAFNEGMLVQIEDGQRQPLTDAIVDGLWLRMDREIGFRPTFIFFEKVLHHLAHETTFHAVKDYLATLQWDGVPRIDTWLSAYAGSEDSPYVRAVSSIVLIAAVRRVRSPGCKYDEMIVLESPQGMNKSSAMRALCADDTWFSDDLPLNVDAKQIIERTLGKWIIEASDLAGKRKAEVEQLKSMLSRQVDGPARLAYARNPIERPRQFILIGTTNSAAYLTDNTGARRYWPIAVKRFDVEALVRDRDQLWAEAAMREAANASIRLPEALWPAAGVEQERRHSGDSWEDSLRAVVLSVSPGFDDKRRIMTKTLWEALGVEPARRDRVGALRIAEIMQRFGMKPTTIRVRGEVAPQRGYLTDDPGALELIEEHLIDGPESGDAPPF